jgi:AcrR family transcriptional regulator
MTTRTRRSDGARTHAAILEAATRLASIEGLEGLTLGRLADEVGVSKSGLYAHFGSKERLQLETIEMALEIFDREVMVPTERAEEGLPRLEAFADHYFTYLEDWVFPGGCFFSSVLAEADARSGPVHDAIEQVERDTRDYLVRHASRAIELGRLRPDVDPAQLAFEFYAFAELANYHFVLFRDQAVLSRGRRAVRSLLDRVRA